MIYKTLPTYEHDYAEKFDIQFKPLLEVVAYNTYFGDSQYWFDPHWDEDLYDQNKLEYKDTYNKPEDQNERDDFITDTHVSEALRYAW